MPVEAEGAAISELALRDRMRPSLFAVRGVRLLGAGGYNTHEYVPRFASPTEVMAAIDEYAIPLVLLQPGQAGRELAHIGQIRDTIAAFPDRWTLLWRSDEGPPAFLYEVVGNAAKPADQAKLTRLSAPRQLVE
ncbi:hypothetical protein [Siccirubricoccus sp. G192]|uniref:hypothetical protein n=1 Tax=Siccirubricoccus sp. G192 TaxID=2849651 RepID=UPI001C2C0EFC|nr:hypothetical protein [Siccirubricoccus sp. G192]MBV1800000.1 hypothetical protein [Siccirubricoccus sp. G192]